MSRDAAAASPWPAEHLQAVPDCPVCGGGCGRELLHADMTDRVFGIAPGTWSLYRCNGCHSGWLDPRPDTASLPLAYVGYFTHDEIRDRVIVRRRGVLRRYLHDALNHYMNHRYGTRRQPVVRHGRWLAWLLPPLRAAVDATCRHLPPVPPAGGRLLDVGCGNGAFLRLASEMGWLVSGLDFDPQAVQQARSAGFDVTVGGVDALDHIVGHYDVITLSHVIEHVTDPNDLLDRLHRLLKPGGRLWLETPNINSFGHLLYGRDWRDLDPPRHLLLPNWPSFCAALARAGFVQTKQRWHPMQSFGILRESEAIKRNERAELKRYKRLLLTGALLEIAEVLFPSRREFLTATTRKPEAI
jgi:2-polyprenyl-3-methyl-5-hydroxy-6-metoxy-1,4-benzoquinol methylase